tara:strand:- start:66 stop:272 length:207 start_codon:yes stop_codon:yes gene_type:complete
MKLNEFRINKNMSYGRLAQLVGCSHATVCRRWCLPVTHPNSMIPDRKFMMAILRLTNGAVQPNDFYMD